MKLKRYIVDAGEFVSDFFAYNMQNRYYKYLFNSYMAKSFEGINDKLTDEYKKKQ